MTAEIRRDLTLKEISRLPGAAGRGLTTQGITTIKHSLATHERGHGRVARELAADLAGKLDRPDPYDAVYRRCDGWR